MSRLSLLSLRVNVLAKTLDPKHHYDSEKLKEMLMSRYPGYRAISFMDDLVYDGREILWNVRSGLHTDPQDPTFSYATLTIFGKDFIGGHLYLPNLGLRIRMQPGDIVMFRGRVLRHVIEDWTGGQRISIPHFTHTSTWRMARGFLQLDGVDLDEKLSDEED